MDNLVQSPATSRHGFYRGRKVLVVGADGFLGLNCVQALRELDADVTIVSRRPVPRAAGFRGRVIHGDLTDQALVRAAVHGQSVVFDFVGISGPAESNREPYRNLEGECRPHLNLFCACAEAEPSPLVVFCSSRVVYGKAAYLPVDEAHPIDAGSFYAVHKVTLENYLRVFRRTQGLRSCVLRLSNAYGPYAPEQDKSYGVLNQFITHAARGGPLTVYGKGDQLRDYIYSEDAMAAFLACAAEEKCHGEVINLGGAVGIQLREAAEQIAEAAGGVPIRFVPWPNDYEVVETGDYRTDLSKLHGLVTLPQQRSFRDGIVATLGSRMSARVGEAKS